jgi:hypothetical protein
VNDRLLCIPALSRNDLVDALKRDLSALTTFERNRNFIDFAECKTAPYAAMTTRLQILNNVYRNDYFTDSTDMERIGKRIASDDELIWFWGEQDDIAHLRAALAHEHLRFESGSIGTNTVISAEQEIGPGYAESCRSGSTPPGVGGKAAFMQRTLDFMTGDRSSVFTGRFHSIISATRNRATTPDVAGGEAIQTIGKQYVRSRFWGYAPWYVMPGGVLELLELREVNRDPDDVRSGLAASKPWQFANNEEAGYASALVAANFDVDVNIEVRKPGTPTKSTTSFRLIKPVDPLLSYNHGAMVPTLDAGTGTHSPEAGINDLETSGVSCSVAYVPLTDSSSVHLQTMLHEYGFVLGGILPPKNTWIRRAGENEQPLTTPAVGIWNRPRPGLPIVPPYYIDTDASDLDEQTILTYTKKHLLI